MPILTSVHATLGNRSSGTYLGPVGEERRILVEFGNSLGIKVDSDRPVMLSKGLVALHLKRSGQFLIGSHLGRR